MSTLKDRFDNLNATPDPQVWDNISATLRRKAILRRRSIIAASAAVVLLAATAFFAFRGTGANTPVAQTDPTATNTTATDAVSPAIEATESTEATVPATVTTSTSVKADAQYQATAAEPAVQASQPAAAQRPATIADATTLPTGVQSAAPAVATITPATSVALPDDHSVRNAQADGQPQTSAQPKATQPTPVQPVVNADELVIWIPNAFSPDDPNPDVQQFKVIPNDDAQIVSFQIFIYSRAGRLVYHSKDINQGWDGIANGHKQPMGTYVYLIEINDAVKGLQHTRGTVTMIR